MRRRRGETSLFEILNPRAEDPNVDPGLWDKMKGLGRGPEDPPSESKEPRAGATAKPPPEVLREARRPAPTPEPSPEGAHRLRAYGIGASVEASPGEPFHRPPLQSSLFTNPSVTDPIDGASFWSWLNRPIETRYATIAVYAVGVVLALYLAYLSGRMVKHPLETALDQATPYSPALIDPSPHFKAPFRQVESETGGPSVPETTPAETKSSGTVPLDPTQKQEKIEAAQKTEPGVTKTGEPQKSWGIVVHEGEDYETSEQLMTRLDRFDQEIGKKVAMDSVRIRGVQKYRVYFGPFDRYEDAQRRVDAVRRLPGIHNQKKNFSDAYVREVQVD